MSRGGGCGHSPSPLQRTERADMTSRLKAGIEQRMYKNTKSQQQQAQHAEQAQVELPSSTSAADRRSPPPPPPPALLSPGYGREPALFSPSRARMLASEAGAAHMFAAALPPLRMVRQASFGVDEPVTATLRTSTASPPCEDDLSESLQGGPVVCELQQRTERRRLLMESPVEGEEEEGEDERDDGHSSSSYSYPLQVQSDVAMVELHLDRTEKLPAPSSPSHEHLTAAPPRSLPALHSYRPLRPLKSVAAGGATTAPLSAPPRVFHSFLLMSLCGLLSISDLCVYVARVCKQWQRHAHDSIAHPARRMHHYAATQGGAALFAELKRLSCVTGIRQRIEAMASSAIHATLRARHQRESFASSSSSASSPRVAPIPRAVAATPVAAPRPTVTSNQVPSVTLLQHLQLLPDAATTAPSGVGGAQLVRRFKSFLASPSGGGLTRLLDSHCLLLSTHLVHLRVLRIFNGSGISNEGVKLLSHQLRHLRILHIGHLTDLLVSDDALQQVGENLLDLHSLWLTQDGDVPQRTIWNPNPRVVYNLFSTSGVARLKNLHRTLHHINLGGFRNLTTQGQRFERGCEAKDERRRKEGVRASC